MSRRDDPPNPYHELKLDTLADALSERACDLMGDRRVGRRDTAHMLITAAYRLRPTLGTPGTPAARMRDGGESPLNAFGEMLDREQRAVRWWILGQALDAAELPHGPERAEVLSGAVESDEACRLALERLGELVAARRARLDSPPGSR